MLVRHFPKLSSVLDAQASVSQWLGTDSSWVGLKFTTSFPSLPSLLLGTRSSSSSPWLRAVSRFPTMALDKVKSLLPDERVDVRIVSAVLCGSATAILVVKWVNQRRVQKKLEEAKGKRELGFQRMEKAARQFKQQNPGVKAAPILALPLVELSAKLKDGSLSPESVLYTYMEKALEVTRQINCVTNFLPECEEQLRETKKKEKGLLYGVPVSIKEDVACKGYPNTLGLVKFLDRPEQEDSVIVKVLKKQGAIPFVKTNLSQAIVNIDCGNTLFGQTLNPFNHKKTSGGSSGGEAALIGGGGSILGIGTDVAASIRVPCGFCGICGIKPTGYRLSVKGASTPVAGMNSVISVTGPMARDVDSLVLCMRALLCDELFRLDSSVPPIPFNEEIYSSSRPLRIGYYDGDGYFQPSPSMRRAVLETRQLLQEAGHTLIPFTPPRIDFLVDELFTKGLYADGCSTLLEKFDGEFVDSTWTNQINCYRLPNLLKRILALILMPLFPRISRHLNALIGVGSVKNFWKNNVDRMAYRDEFIAEWRKLKLDVVLCPALGPAFNLGYAGKLFVATTYTHLYNVLNFPAGVVPVTTVTQADEEELKLYKGHYGDPWDKRMKEAVEGAIGLPVAVQCVALPWQEELCLRFMKEVEKVSHERRGRRKI
ncbi:vitamin D3 hydroxylase-associated protein-like [Podarcis muralis]|uniref:Fatty-acid amide hydrolase 1 n=1 Tax=Podarcis muralis TaxID=64176 RepID=A0A670IJI5_PODMU|nr:vitamin D3 hydroxylase-associated protein-like [Podarcis muralis]